MHQVLINKDVYFTHFSEQFEVYKESTLKSNNKVEIPKKFPIELIPGRSYYFQNYRFVLLEHEDSTSSENYTNQAMSTQLIEEFNGTMQLDDILDIQPAPIMNKLSTTQQFATTQLLCSQQPCSSTLILDETEIKQADSLSYEISSLQELISQYSIARSATISISNQDVATQTELAEQTIPVSQKPTLFSALFKSKQQQQQMSVLKYLAPNQKQVTNLDVTQIDSQLLGATVEDNEQQKFFEKKQQHEAKGTVIDEELEKVFSSQHQSVKQEHKKQSQESSLLKRVDSVYSEQPQNQFSFSKADANSNIELNDIFGSLPELPRQQIAQPQYTKKVSSLKQNLFQFRQDEEKINEEKNGSQENKQETPKKKQKKNDETNDTEKKKNKIKRQKDIAKKGDILKKITDEISSESSNNQEQQFQSQKKQILNNQKVTQEQPEGKYTNIRYANSIELPPTKIFEEKGHNVVPKKKRGLRKKRLINNERVFHLIAFSGFQQNEIPSENILKELDLEIVDNQYEKFDLLIINSPPKRTFKFLAALMLGAEIVTIDWLKDSIKHNELQNHLDYIPESKEFENSFGLSIKQIIQSRDEHFESNDNRVKLFENKYLVNEDAIPGKAEVEYLIKLGGGEIVKRGSKNVTIISEAKKGNSFTSDFILDACMFQQ